MVGNRKVTKSTTHRMPCILECGPSGVFCIIYKPKFCNNTNWVVFPQKISQNIFGLYCLFFILKCDNQDLIPMSLSNLKRCPPNDKGLAKINALQSIQFIVYVLAIGHI